MRQHWGQTAHAHRGLVTLCVSGCFPFRKVDVRRVDIDYQFFCVGHATLAAPGLAGVLHVLLLLATGVTETQRGALVASGFHLKVTLRELTAAFRTSRVSMLASPCVLCSGSLSHDPGAAETT